VRRIRFIGQVIVSGSRWARSVIDESLVLLGLVGLTVGVTAGGLLLHRPGWFLGIFGALIVVVILVEGAFRVHETSQTSVVPAHITVADRLEHFAQEFELLLREIPPNLASEPNLAFSLNMDYNALVAEVNRELRRNAPAFLPAWKQQPDKLGNTVAPTHFSALYAFAVEQLRTIANEWRKAQ
jgi:hypothetical protein